MQILKSLHALYTRGLHINVLMYLMTYNKDLAGGGGWQWKKEISPFIHIALWILGKGEANENSRRDMVYLLGAHKLEIIIIIIEFFTSQPQLGNIHLSWDV
jgi:hypothetical protein